ncbi:DUF389 domain-containing protein, partial [Candidatus Kaiserbacteria bacterium]|nr:DUF389 domain-containing protein [Candidatus Kaiserbacteria bacterium]
VAIAVALIPPLAAIGIGIASLNPVIIKGATMILALNLFGIITVSVVMFLLMNLSEKGKIAESTIRREEEKRVVEDKIIADMTEQISPKPQSQNVVIKENIQA